MKNYRLFCIHIFYFSFKIDFYAVNKRRQHS